MDIFTHLYIYLIKNIVLKKKNQKHAKTKYVNNMYQKKKTSIHIYIYIYLYIEREIKIWIKIEN